MTLAPTSTETAIAADTLLDGVDLQALALRIGTPCQAYSASLIRQRIVALQTALRGLDALVCYAAKANSNVAILELMAEANSEISSSPLT